MSLLNLNAEHVLLIFVGAIMGSVLTLFLLRVYFNRWKSHTLEMCEKKKSAEIAEYVMREQALRAEGERVQADLRHSAEVEGTKYEAEIQFLSSRMAGLGAELDELRKLKEDHLQLQARLEEQSRYVMKEKALLEDARKSLFKEFELSAHKLYEAKQKSFSQESRSGMEAVLTPFKDQLKDFRKRVEDIYHKENSERSQLVGKIAELQKQTAQIGEEANNLASALKGDNKVQGDWGEIILEKLLEQSGLQKGREYETQKSLSAGDGRRAKPDVVVHLPDQKDIVIDSKVSLTDYQRYCDAESDPEKEAYLKAHIDSLRTHIKSLSFKEYEKLEGLRTLDFVFIFIPIESAYILAVHSSPELFKLAYEKNIVLVSPTSLMVALRTVEMLWRYEKQNNHAETIADAAGKLYDQFVLLSESFDNIGLYLDKATHAYETSCKRLVSGRGNLLGRVEKLRVLGAKNSRTLSKKLKDQVDLQKIESELGVAKLDSSEHALLEEERAPE